MVDPVRRVLVVLADARSAGVAFEAAWPVALRAAKAASAGWDWAGWQAALLSTRPAWQRAFDGAPATALDQAVGLLAHGLSGRSEAAGAVLGSAPAASTRPGAGS